MKNNNHRKLTPKQRKKVRRKIIRRDVGWEKLLASLVRHDIIHGEDDRK